MSDFPSPLHDAILPCIEISVSWPFRRVIRGAILAAVDLIFKVRGRADLGVRGNDVLNQAVGEIILFGICTHVLKR